jgi:hypothetical protein
MTLRRALVFAAAAFLVGAAPRAPSSSSPAVTIADPKSLAPFFAFGSLPPKAGGATRGAVHWRIDIALPPHAVLDHADVQFARPPVLHLKDGRCFRIDIDQDWTARFHLSGARTTQIVCPVSRNPNDPDLKPISRAGMQYMDRAWDIDAYAEARSGRTLFFQTGQKDAVPLLSTGMHVLALGAMGCPDCGATDLRLLGTVDGRLVLAGVQLNVAYA